MKKNTQFTPEDDRKIIFWLEKMKPTFCKPKKMNWKGASLDMFNGVRTASEIKDRYNKCLKYKGITKWHGRFSKKEKIKLIKGGPTSIVTGRTPRQTARCYLTMRKQAAARFGIAIGDVTTTQLLTLVS
jgi:hypothetical protein